MRQRVAEIGEPAPDNETPQRAGEKGDADPPMTARKKKSSSIGVESLTHAIAGVFDPPIQQMFVVVPVFIEC